MAAVEASSAQPSAPVDAQAGTPSNTAGALMSRGDVNPALDAAALERIAKREAKKALKAARAAAAIEKRKRPLPWNEVRPDLPFLYAADHAHQHRKACATVPEMRGA